MKAFKTDIINAIVSEAAGSRIVSLREIANAQGINHISRNDVIDIMRAALKQLPDYRPVRMERTANDSLFCSLCFVENDVEFDDGETFETEVE